jgi:hypothetical protein
MATDAAAKVYHHAVFDLTHSLSPVGQF